MAKNQRDFFKKKNEWSEIKDNNGSITFLVG